MEGEEKAAPQKAATEGLYAALSREDEAAAREDAAIIKTNLRSAAESVITVGQALVRQKVNLGHGRFLGWIDAEFGMTERSSQRFMKIAEVYSGNTTPVSHLGVKALYELAADSTPQEVRDRVEELFVDGKVVTPAKIRELKAEAKAAREEAERLRLKPPGVITVAIEDISLEDVFRRDVGDIAALAASIEKLGMLQWICIDPDHRLQAGYRRLLAAKHLGWTHIQAKVVPRGFTIQEAENETRKDLTPSELVALDRAIEQRIFVPAAP